MRNLKNSSAALIDIDLQTGRESIICAAFDVERNRMFFASSENFIYGIQLADSQKSLSESKALSPMQVDQIFLEPGDCIVSMDYLMEKEALIIGTADGCLILHTVDLNSFEIVGRVEGGVKSIASSPDGALIAVTAGFGQLLVMTCDWEVLYETEPNLQVYDTGDMNGSTDNWFHAPISWRGDGKYLVTIAGMHDSSLQNLKIWERESGLLHSSSQSKKFMGESLDWMPSGAKIVAACDRRDENKPPLIVFFEKNGLERNSFSIEGPAESIVNTLKWNSSSELLCASVCCESYNAVQIWYFSNYHWYLKQEMKYSKEDAVKFMWDPTKPLRLICWTSYGKVKAYNFIWITAVTDKSIALVIDSENILVTPFSVSLMPPPMYLFKLKFPSVVQDIAFLSKNTTNYLAACLSDGCICIVDLPDTNMWEEFEGKEFIIENSISDLKIKTLMHLVWLDSHVLLVVSQYQQNYSLLEIEVVCSENSIPATINSSGWHAKTSKCLSLEGPVIDIVKNPAKRCSAFVQMDGGSVFEYDSTMGLRLNELDSDDKFTSSCPWMKAVPFCKNNFIKALLVGLDESGRLHIGSRILCNICSSFSFYSKSHIEAEEVVSHMLLTTKQDLLFIISLNEILHGQLELKFDRPNIIHKKEEENKDYLNIWERGAKLVGVIHGDEAAAVLQTTRGNLECIYPRKLVLVSIINALIQRRFKDALLMVRRHRIDFNVIVDCCGLQMFIESATDFVCQVNNLNHITEFACSIKNDDVMDTLYKDYISIETLPRPKEISSGYSNQSKVSLVLLTIRKALIEQVTESPARELCVLTTLARSEPPALEEALTRIKMIREMELSKTNDNHRKLYPSSEESLKHLLWLTDTEEVYEAALGLYDLNLAAMVALNSQKDPKEFLPYLKELESLLPVVMKYTIDLKLQRFDKALRHIYSAGNEYYEDCMNLMKNNPQLFPLGLQLFSNNVNRIQVFEAWGDHLVEEKQYEEAASAYLCCSSYQKALKAYRDSGNWRSVFSVAGILKLAKEDILRIANELCEEFQAVGKPSEAAKIALEYIGDVSKSVGYCIMAREWDEALRVSYLHEREDLASEVCDGAVECAHTIISECNEGSEKVCKYLARYLAVRQRRLVLAAKIQAEDSLVNDADYDTVSEVSSNLSDMSAYTTRSTRNTASISSTTTASKAKRSQRKKGGRIRAGSPGEEMALVDHIKGMSLTTGAQRELKSLILALLMLGKEDIAQQLQNVADNFELSQAAAMKLVEDTLTTTVIDERKQTLDHYMKKLREATDSRVLSWQSKVLLQVN